MAPARTDAILALVASIPEGFVRTYGDIDPRAPRLVGHVLATTTVDVPWHRVVRADGSLPMGARQRRLLLEEGVPMRRGRVLLALARLHGVPLDGSAPRSQPAGSRPGGATTATGTDVARRR